MTTGMLWWCTKPSLEENVQAAAEYYENKYGRKPDLCLVHPNMLKDLKVDGMNGLTIRPYRPVLPGHLWVGVEEMPTAPKESMPA